MYFIKLTDKVLRKPTPKNAIYTRGSSPDSLIINFFLVIFLFSTSASALEINSNTTLANAGYYQLSWTDLNDEAVIVEESLSNSFSSSKKIYSGKDTSTAISGKPDGEYYYRVKNLNSSIWSESISVKVEHHSLTKAFMFFFLGLIVFTFTCIVILRNHKTA